MSNVINRFAKAVRGRTRQPDYFYAIWQSSEAVDANLSQVSRPSVNGGWETIRFVPKLQHVTGLTTSSTVLCVGSPVCIVGIVVGDTSLAEL